MALSLRFSDIGVVFDLDGVLIDSHDQHQRSWYLLAEERGLTLTEEQFKESFGMRNEMCIPHVFHWAEPEDSETIRILGDRKEELYRELLAADGVVPLPGVLSLLHSLRDAGVPVSLGSSTSRKNIEACFSATGLDDFFGKNITGAEDVRRGKPHPDVFLKAAQKIDRRPQHCLVIEDAHVGIDAGVAAGMRVLAVTTTHSHESLAGHGASRIVASLVGIFADTVLEILGGPHKLV